MARKKKDTIWGVDKKVAVAGVIGLSIVAYVGYNKYQETQQQAALQQAAYQQQLALMQQGGTRPQQATSGNKVDNWLQFLGGAVNLGLNTWGQVQNMQNNGVGNVLN